MAKSKHAKQNTKKRRTYGKAPKHKHKNKNATHSSGGYKPYKGADSEPMYVEGLDFPLHDNDFMVAEQMDSDD